MGKRRPLPHRNQSPSLGRKPKMKAEPIVSTRIAAPDGTEYDAIRCPSCKGSGCGLCDGLGFTKQTTLTELLPDD